MAGDGARIGMFNRGRQPEYRFCMRMHVRGPCRTVENPTINCTAP